MEVLHCDAEIIVVNKHSGLPVLPDGWEPDAPFLVGALEAEYGKVWVVHRLDKATSGVIVLARTAEAHRSMSMQFERREAHKVYEAILNGAPEWVDRTTRKPLRMNVGHKHRTVVDPRQGKRSETTFSVLERFPACTFAQAVPTTGRTHQIRAHAAALGFPIAGDTLYGAPPTELIARPALHAASLSFTPPGSDQLVTYTAPRPDDFLRALEQLRHQRG